MLLTSALATAIPIAAMASETNTYTYDALGRLIVSTKSGGPNNGVSMATCFDQAGNRLRHDITSSTPAACPTPTPTPTPSP